MLFPALLIMVICQCDHTPQEELVHIPDPGFLARLIAMGVDSNGDGQISFSEAEVTRSIVVPPLGITDLTGLEAFIHLDSFTITLNPLEHLDFSLLSTLRFLSCTNCELTSLDVTGNPDLEHLNCGYNMLKELDVGYNPSLVTLVCNNNLLTTLDLSANPALVKMISCGNLLTRLDISGNTSLQLIGFDNMPMLTEVCVWTVPFPPSGVTTLQAYSPNVFFTDQCSGF